MRVVLAGGGTAGHIEPALALADTLRQLDPEIGITCLGTERGLETRLVPQRGYELELVPAVPLPRTLTPQLLTVPGRLAGAINAALLAASITTTSFPVASSLAATSVFAMALSNCVTLSVASGRVWTNKLDTCNSLLMTTP